MHTAGRQLGKSNYKGLRTKRSGGVAGDSFKVRDHSIVNDDLTRGLSMKRFLKTIENWARRNFRCFDRRKTIRQAGSIRYCIRVGDIQQRR